MKIFRLICFLALLLGAWTSIQSAVIKGRSVDETEALPGVSVQLFTIPDSTRVSYATSGVDGSFTLKNISKGHYRLLLSMTGMENVEKNIEIEKNDQVVNLGDLKMIVSATLLKEAVVTAVKAAVVAKQDTIEFNADSYHTAPNATVNDLLKKLPGVEVDQDGSIKSNGKSVTKILVNGKEFFGDDPQMATKNLPSNMVDRVQVVDRKSDLARLTGVDDGEEETVINLTVKKDMNNGWFGNAKAGYGTDERYTGSFVINRFFNGNQITLLGGGNNINERGFSDRGMGMFRGGRSGGINTTQQFGINFNVGKDEKFRVGGNILYSHSDQSVLTKSERQNILPTDNTIQTSGSHSRDKGNNISSDFRIQWNIDEYNTLDFRPSFRVNFRNSLSNDSSKLFQNDDLRTPIRSSLNSQFNKGTNWSTGGNLIFNHKVASHPGRSFSLQANYSFSDNRQKSTSWSDIIYYLIQEGDNDDATDDSYFRFLDNHTWSNSIRGRLTWTEPLGDSKNGNFMNIAYNIRYQWNNADQYTYNLPKPNNPENFIIPEYSSLPEGAVLDEVLSNSFRNNYFNQELQAGYKRVTKAYTIDLGMLLTPSMSKSIDLINSARNIPERWTWNVAPYARLRYRFGKQTSLRADYRARTSQPSMSQLQPVADESDPLNVKQGNPNLKPTFTQSINIHFNDYRTSTQQALFMMLNASIAQNTIISKTTIEPLTRKRFTTYTNANGNFNIFGMAMMNRPFRNRKWRFNVRMNARYAASPGYINDDFNRSGNLNLSPGAGLTFSSDIFQISVNPNYSYQLITNSLAGQKDRETQSVGFWSDASLYLPFGLQLNTDLRFSNSYGYSAGFNSKTWLWNAELSYSFLNDKSLTISAKAYDLLGMTRNISRSNTYDYIQDTQYNNLTRYFMVSLTWNFNTLKKKGRGPTGEEMNFDGRGRHGGPMGPPPGGMGGRRR